MSRILGTIVAIAWCLVTGEVLAQVGPPPWQPIEPPPGFHYRGPLVVHRVANWWQGELACAPRIANSLACQWWQGGWTQVDTRGRVTHGKQTCHVVVYDAATLRHELAHCAGWRHDGQFGTPGTYVPGRDGNQGS